jgi:hypothetical protein
MNRAPSRLTRLLLERRARALKRHLPAAIGGDGIGVHLWGPSGIEPKDSNTMFRIRVEGIEELYGMCGERGIVHPNAPLEAKPWGAREFAILDVDGNLLTFFER